MSVAIGAGHWVTSSIGRFSSSKRCPYIQRWLDLDQPILGRGNAAKIFSDMLFSYIPDWNFVSVAIHNDNSKQLLCRENALRVMP
jgi:hypothetical protein